MIFKVSYKIQAAHLNTGFPSLESTPRGDWWKAIHGHNWELGFEVEGNVGDNGFVYDELVLRSIVMTLNNTFLPEHPRLASYGASQEGVTRYMTDFASIKAPKTVKRITAFAHESPDICFFRTVRRSRKGWRVA